MESAHVVSTSFPLSPLVAPFPKSGLRVFTRTVATAVIYIFCYLPRQKENVSKYKAFDTFKDV